MTANIAKFYPITGRLEQNMSDDVAPPLQFTDAAANKVKSYR